MFGKKRKTPLYSMERTDSQPVSDFMTQVYIELSTKCNLNCTTCPRHTLKDFDDINMSRKTAEKLIENLREFPTIKRIVFIGYGEALCNPELPFILKSIGKMRKKTALITNGLLLTPEISRLLITSNIEELYFSWDDPVTEEKPSIRRGASAETFARNIRTMEEIKIAWSKTRPTLHMETVATRSNVSRLKEIIHFGRGLGIQSFLITNLIPPREEMKEEILYTVFDKPEFDLHKILKHEMKEIDIQIADQRADRMRCCPFIEEGSFFISAKGDVSPCMELAYSHRAYFFGSPRMIPRKTFGNIHSANLRDIWAGDEARAFRDSFLYYDYPDCSTCYAHGKCSHREMDDKDCGGNVTPCGECLWAKNILQCP